ncbi:hypothetical protein EDI_258080 [Entamoeba dispar SAW760]|uniref:Uncharacterized protein n=1 Tax=Entamoeba dispar (strain ATCC PRA-260 / SAW760) TaxID=370354 RepID=B0EQR5_ENTDS|nr:uncharacterized protein EDI_258080 [Entamoeba dispar SAW760]EDR23130.1 hypothetical protein EDI_258080 [Entamoeba dispar SAW760]|eukprot:EDR23130.1 hypothetical protein EDI_258080 [Entamoeba dispar SAW760]
MSVEETAQWIAKMFDHIPVEFYHTEIEDSKNTKRKFEVAHDDLAVDLNEISKRQLSVEGKMTISQYNEALLAMKKDQIKQTAQPLMEEDQVGEELTENPTIALKRKLHAKIDEVHKGKTKNLNTKVEKTELPESKKHFKHHNDNKQKHQSKKEKQEGKVEPFVRPTMTSPVVKDNLDFGTIAFTSGKTVPKYLNKKQKHD